MFLFIEGSVIRRKKKCHLMEVVIGQMTMMMGYEGRNAAISLSTQYAAG